MKVERNFIDRSEPEKPTFEKLNKCSCSYFDKEISGIQWSTEKSQ